MYLLLIHEIAVCMFTRLWARKFGVHILEIEKIIFFLYETFSQALGTTESHTQNVPGRRETLTTHLRLVQRLRMSGASPTERQPYLLTYYLKSVQASDGQFNNLVRVSLLMP
jgi:hypothetical protein